MGRIIVNGRNINDNDDDYEIIFLDDKKQDDKKKYSFTKGAIMLLFVLVAYLVSLIYLVIHCPVTTITHFILTLFICSLMNSQN